MRANPLDWRIEDLKVLAAHYSIEAKMLTVPAARPIKPVYIKRFVALIDKMEATE
jgi:hypothetical protein